MQCKLQLHLVSFQSLAQKKLGEKVSERRTCGSTGSSYSNLSHREQLEGATAAEPSSGRPRNARDSMESLQSLCSDYDHVSCGVSYYH